MADVRVTESIAEYCQRPLMVLTSADVGTNSTALEHKLTERFNTAKSWGAVLLIDEADVFMERRGTADLERNSLVAGKRFHTFPLPVHLSRAKQKLTPHL